MVRLRPITSRLMQRIVKDGVTRGAALVECDPAGRVERKPSLFLSDELDRIVGHHHGVSARENMDRLLHTSRDEPATTARILRDVVIADGTLLGATGVVVLRSGTRQPVLTRPLRRLPEAMLCTDWVIERYFGHWIADGWSREQLALDYAMVPSVLTTAAFTHTGQYRAMTGLHAQSLDNVRVDRLWIIDDRGYNVGRTERYNRVRARLRNATSRGGPRHVFIRRGEQAVGRSLLNEQEVTIALEQRGFVVIAPEQMTADAIASTLREARLVVGVEGSALAHANAAADCDACIFAIQSPTAFNSIHRLGTSAARQRFAFSVGDPDQGESFTMPVERLLRSLSMVESKLG